MRRLRRQAALRKEIRRDCTYPSTAVYLLEFENGVVMQIITTPFSNSNRYTAVLGYVQSLLISFLSAACRRKRRILFSPSLPALVQGLCASGNRPLGQAKKGLASGRRNDST